MDMSNISKIYNWTVGNFFEKISTSDGDVLTKASKNIDSSSNTNVLTITFKSGKIISLSEENIVNVSQCDSVIRVEYKEKDSTNTLILTTSKENIKKQESIKENNENSYKKDLYGQKRKVATILGNNSKIKDYLNEMEDKPLGIILKNSNGEIKEYLYYPFSKAIEEDLNVSTIDCTNCEVVNFDVPWDFGAKVLVIYDEDDTLLLFPYLKTTFSSMSAIMSFSSLNDVLKMSSPEEIRKEQQANSLIEERSDVNNNTSISEESFSNSKDSGDTYEVEEVSQNVDPNTSISDTQYEDDDDTISECYHRIAKYMKKTGIGGINFWTDKNDKIHCDITLETIFED